VRSEVPFELDAGVLAGKEEVPMTKKNEVIEFKVTQAQVVADGVLVTVNNGQVKFPPGTKLEIGETYQVPIDSQGKTKLDKGEVVSAGGGAEKVVAAGASSPPTKRDW